MEWITDSQIWLSLITLTALEIILGIDNIVVISLLTNKLPHEQQPKARKIGIGLALITRILFRVFVF
jgi:predicted tellurium resistance membrane protein TerC